MHHDERALKIWIDGSAFKNPGTDNGLAGVVQYPEFLNRIPKIIFREAYEESNISRMELKACIKALEYIQKNHTTLKGEGIHRFQVITDSQYVYNNQNRAFRWRQEKWRGANGQPIENKDLWQKFLSLRSTVPAEIIWHPGKTTELNRLVDKLAKEAAKLPVKKKDFGFRPGKISRAPVKGGSAPYPANGQTEVIKIYRYELKGVGSKKEQKIYFSVISDAGTVSGKFFAYMARPDLSRHGVYTAKFNANPKYPIIESLVLMGNQRLTQMSR